VHLDEHWPLPTSDQDLGVSLARTDSECQSAILWAFRDHSEVCDFPTAGRVVAILTRCTLQSTVRVLTVRGPNGKSRLGG
jgi:hypothetical protein